MIAYRKNDSGFTIVELLIVIAIIAILATITFVSFTALRQRANESASATAVATANKKLDVYKIANRFYPNALSQAEIYDYANTTYQYTLDGTKLAYCLTATTNNVSMYGSTATPQPVRGGCVGHIVDGAPPITNYVLNPGFENGALNPNWLVAGGAGYAYGINAAQKYSGTYSALISLSTATVLNSFLYTSTAAVPTAGTYYVSAWVYLNSSANSYSDTATPCAGNGLDARFYGGVSTVSACYNRSALNSWQKVTATVTAVAGATLQLRFYPPVANTSILYVDNVMVTNGVTNYADGSSPGWVWSGAPNGSTSSGPAL